MNLVALTLSDSRAEQVRASHHEAIAELQSSPLGDGKVVSEVRLENGKATAVAHKLGRSPKWVGISAVRGATSAGFINETRTGDRSKSVTLTASGYGATITVDVLVV